MAFTSYRQSQGHYLAVVLRVTSSYLGLIRQQHLRLKSYRVRNARLHTRRAPLHVCFSVCVEKIEVLQNQWAGKPRHHLVDISACHISVGTLTLAVHDMKVYRACRRKSLCHGAQWTSPNDRLFPLHQNPLRGCTCGHPPSHYLIFEQDCRICHATSYQKNQETRWTVHTKKKV